MARFNYYYKNYYGRRSYPTGVRNFGQRNRYSIEHASGSMTIPASGYNFQQVIVPETAVQGMRKVKNITISFANAQSSTSDIQNVPIFYALVYVPNGTTPNNLALSGDANSPGSLYEPSQFVIQSGLIDFEAGPNRIWSPLARNLNEGDSIYLVISQPVNSTGARNIYYSASYAITLQ